MSLIATLLIYVLYAFMIVLFVRVAFSWLSPYPTNAVSRFAYRVTDPVLEPVRRYVPPMSGLDLSPLVVWLVVIFVIAALRTLQ
ncbi:MAG TPA: YggT family protein [Candidatus Dormibacteraeota bacterium]|jgi:YggT family protein|nr:YggT family protein [Candidatus Dormibacteraeota bacterium]